MSQTNSRRIQNRRGVISEADRMYEKLEARSKQAERNMEAIGFSIVNVNGQRISTNTRLQSRPVLKARWNEIFIGKLPRDLFEDQLLHFLMYPAEVYSIRYMLDFSHSNRGYCYVKYANTEEAARAIKYLDNRTVVPGRPPIGAKISFDNRTLYFSNLPLSCTEQKLEEVLEKAEVDEIVSVRMLTPPRNQSRGLVGISGQPASFLGELQLPVLGPRAIATNKPTRSALVTFSSHDAATRARRLLLPGDVILFGKRIKLDWAKSEVPASVQAVLERYMLTGPALALQHRNRNESGETSANTDSSSCTSPSSFGDINNNTTMFAHEMHQNPFVEMHSHDQQSLCSSYLTTRSAAFEPTRTIFKHSWNDLNLGLSPFNYKAMLDSGFIGESV